MEHAGVETDGNTLVSSTNKPEEDFEVTDVQDIMEDHAIWKEETQGVKQKHTKSESTSQVWVQAKLFVPKNHDKLLLSYILTVLGLWTVFT